MIDIYEILKKISNLEDYTFYSPLYGDVKVSLANDYTSFPIYIQMFGRCNITSNALTREGFYSFNSAGKREIMLYPSREQRDWSAFKIPRKDLHEGTSVMVSQNKKEWYLNIYNKKGHSRQTILHRDSIPWNYIIPVDKFNFNDWSFNEEDNYGTAYK